MRATYPHHLPDGAVEVAARVGISYRQLDHWLRIGMITLECDANGSGSRRVFTPEEELALHLMVTELRRAERIIDHCRSGEFYREELEIAKTLSQDVVV